jgi:hypothetical protein
MAKIQKNRFGTLEIRDWNLFEIWDLPLRALFGSGYAGLGQ